MLQKSGLRLFPVKQVCFSTDSSDCDCFSFHPLPQCTLCLFFCAVSITLPASVERWKKGLTATDRIHVFVMNHKLLERCVLQVKQPVTVFSWTHVKAQKQDTKTTISALPAWILWVLRTLESHRSQTWINTASYRYISLNRVCTPLSTFNKLFHVLCPCLVPFLAEVVVMNPGQFALALFTLQWAQQIKIYKDIYI